MHSRSSNFIENKTLTKIMRWNFFKSELDSIAPDHVFGQSSFDFWALFIIYLRMVVYDAFNLLHRPLFLN